MLNLTNVENQKLDFLLEIPFDIGIFASGYESRSSHLAKNLDLSKIKNKIVLGFDENSDNAVRQKNDRFYAEWGFTSLVISSQEERLIYAELINLFEKVGKKQEINILVDYTSMARIWYSGILNFIRLQNSGCVNVYLNYSIGLHEETLVDYNYSSINSIPFHEGTLSTNNKTLLVLAIGFSPYLIKSVIEEIEPNTTIGILPIPNYEDTYKEFTDKIKDDILTGDISEWLNSPINDLESIFRTYAEISNINLSTKDIIFLSLGPKIFTLASLLVSQRFPQVTCLYLKSANRSQLDIRAAGDFVCSKITYKQLGHKETIDLI
ncbi:MAG: hypothetical protein EOO20_24220 [Chryseobacterium sp.]|nr:MAG: hypothetical protein EOO20_24220 [Chryseobacterium sp.]